MSIVQLLPGGITLVKPGPGVPNLPISYPGSLSGLDSSIFPDGPPRTPPYWDHTIARPETFAEANRWFYEPVDFPGWNKHPLVRAQMNKQNPYGTPRALFESLYDLDARGGARRAEDRCVERSEGIAGAILVTLGIQNVHVALDSVNVTDNGTISEQTDVSINFDNEREWTVMLFYFGSDGGNEGQSDDSGVGHWTAGVWNEQTRELYHFDAFKKEREKRQNNLVKGWGQLLLRNRRNGEWAFVQAPQHAQTNWECGWIAVYNIFNFFRRSLNGRREWNGTDRVESKFPVQTWGPSPYTLSQPLTRTSYNARRDRMVLHIRGWVYSFFGWPVDFPLNPYRPLHKVMPIIMMRSGAERNWWWAMNPEDPLPPRAAVKKFDDERDARLERVPDLVAHMRRRLQDGKPDWPKQDVRGFWYAENETALDLSVYKPSGAQTYNHVPYEAGQRGKPYGPYENIFSNRVGWNPPTPLDRIHRSPSASPTRRPPVDRTTTSPTQHPAGMGFVPINMPGPSADTRSKPGQQSAPPVKKTSPPPAFRGVSPSDQQTLGRLFRGTSVEAGFKRPATDTSLRSSPSPDLPVQVRQPVEPETPRTAASRKALKMVEIDPDRQTARKLLQEQRKVRPPTRHSSRLAQQPATQGFNMTYRAPTWFEDYRITQFTGNDGQVYPAPMSNCYGETTWKAVHAYIQERQKKR